MGAITNQTVHSYSIVCYVGAFIYLSCLLAMSTNAYNEQWRLRNMTNWWFKQKFVCRLNGLWSESVDPFWFRFLKRNTRLTPNFPLTMFKGVLSGIPHYPPNNGVYGVWKIWDSNKSLFVYRMICRERVNTFWFRILKRDNRLLLPEQWRLLEYVKM